MLDTHTLGQDYPLKNSSSKNWLQIWHGTPHVNLVMWFQTPYRLGCFHPSALPNSHRSVKSTHIFELWRSGDTKMIKSATKQVLSCALSCLLVISAVPFEVVGQQSTPNGYSGQGAPLYPAEYGNSGVMTFMINQDGLLLLKDLGKTTTETATARSVFDPDPSWSPVEQ